MTRSPSEPAPAHPWPLLLLAGFTVAAPLAGAAVLLWSSADWLPSLTAAEARLPVFLAAGIVLAGLSLVPTHAVSLVAGMLFGSLAGTAAAAFAIVAAALLGFVVMRPLAGPRTTAWLASRPRADAVRRALMHSGRGRASTTIALVRLSPVMPFALTNLLLAGLGSGLREFSIGTTVGLLPRITLVAVAGDGLSELDLSRGSDRTTLVIGVVATLLALVVIGRIARRALASGAP